MDRHHAPGEEWRHQASQARRRGAWAEAFEVLVAADEQAQLSPAELELLATAAYLTGRDEVGDEVSARGYRTLAELGDTTGAARYAVWLGIHLHLRAEEARSSGWFARAKQQLDDGGRDCAEQGYLLVRAGLGQLATGDGAAALATFRTVADIGARFHDRDLVAFGRLGTGQALIQLGQTSQGLASLDEVMVAVTAGEISPIATGIQYCAVIEACQEVFDLQRLQEWTASLDHWCAAQPDLVPYRGQCLVHRVQIMTLRGSWNDASTRPARLATASPVDPPRGPPSTTSASCTGCAATSRPLRRPTCRRADGWRNRNPAWRCCGSRRARATSRGRRSAMSWT